ncbi:EF-hand domain-containing protein [Gemmata sp. SH-PL17]|nr:EF-hand domain-containing protein [Gemmata sp. SH-PL17]
MAHIRSTWANEIMGEVDRDGDGAISWAELESVFRANKS